MVQGTMLESIKNTVKPDICRLTKSVRDIKQEIGDQIGDKQQQIGDKETNIEINKLDNMKKDLK